MGYLYAHTQPSKPREYAQGTKIMETSKNTQVQKFLDDIKALSDWKFQALQKAREIVFDVYPSVDERIMYGGIMFSLDDDFGGIFVNKKHLSFEFSNGITFNDPDKYLEGSGKHRRHLKLKGISDIGDKQVSFFVQQAR
ncbi:MAG: DUF1801 domain-containing protein [Robiginitomaculum sp.]|nr:DUF1801 domain-containing protein [Robiginitomaculum sp.]